MTRVIIEQNAKNDLAKVIQHIAKDSPARAEKYIIELITSVNDTLSTFPLSSPLYDKKLNVRRFVYQKYNIYYRYDDEQDIVYILQIINSAKLKGLFDKS
jgi:toxin ParE1/3/4